ncbi:MAG TPA: hemerythrin domain-containing protein [Usitatibacter sp.]|nr:hemerythrin domain-containing protein [Usitatibacter sp.]
MDIFDDIRDQLRRDHETALAEIDALRAEGDDHRCRFRLKQLRRAWMIHALAEETVVYRALEGAEAAGTSAGRADERFVEHELVESCFEKLSAGRPRTLEWRARLNVVRELMARHIETEHEETFSQLAERFDSEELCELGRQFQLARRKLTMLEEMKAA